MIRPGEKSRLVPLVLAVCLAVLVFACSSGSDQPADEAAMAPPPPRPRPAFVVDAVLPDQPAAPAPAAAAPPAATTADAVPAAPSTASGITFGTVPEQPQLPVEQLTAPRHPLAKGSRVFSNKDLETYRRVKQEFGFQENVMVVDLSGQKQAGATDDLSPEERARQTQETRAQIERISNELQYLKGRIPSLHNPFLPRVAPSEADASAEAGMDNAERLARVTQRITALNSEMGGLQKKLADLASPPDAANGAPAPRN